MRTQFGVMLISLVLVGCPFAKRQEVAPSGRPQQITAKTLPTDRFFVEAEVLESVVRIYIHNPPADALFACELDDAVQTECGDRVEWLKPEAGDHTVRITARRGDEVIAVDETIFTIGGVVDVTTIQPALDNPLALLVDNADYRNGAAVDMSRELRLRVKFAKDPGCTASFKCNYDSLSNTFWHDCGTDNAIPIGHMARGLQYFSIQANCGDQVGPKLDLYWYGVPENYQPMALDYYASNDKQRYIFTLIKANDCPDELLRFMCAADEFQAFAECSNVQVGIKSGFRVKAMCQQDSGPILTLP
jgi:hypothetical protein